MNARIERQLLRLLAGELAPDEARELEQRIAAEAELAAAHRRLAARWQGLEPPPPRPVPPGFAGRVVARARAERQSGASLAAAPAWVRLAAALSLAAGLGLGAGLGLWQSAVGLSGGTAGEELNPDEGTSLAAAYWSAVEGGSGDDGGEEAP